MTPLSWIRVVVCGLAVGIVWHLLAAVLLGLVGQEFLATVASSRRHPSFGGLFFFVVDLGMGVSAMWLYAAIGGRFGSGPKVAAIAGTIWWFIKTLESVKWVAVGLVPPLQTPALAAWTLPIMIVSTMVGAWLYEKTTVAKT